LDCLLTVQRDAARRSRRVCGNGLRSKSFGRSDDAVHFSGYRLDIVGSVPTGFGAGFIEHGSEAGAAFLGFLQKPQAGKDKFADAIVGEFIEFWCQVYAGCHEKSLCQ
jgi:hypothetical protein